MQIYGLAKDQNGKEYFMMKNSWGDYGPYKGFWYVSKPYAAYKTMNIVINKKRHPPRPSARSSASNNGSIFAIPDCRLSKTSPAVRSVPAVNRQTSPQCAHLFRFAASRCAHCV